MAQLPPRPHIMEQQSRQAQQWSTMVPTATTAWTQRSTTPQRAMSPSHERQRSLTPGISQPPMLAAPGQYSPADRQRSLTPMRQRAAPQQTYFTPPPLPPMAQRSTTPTPQQQQQQPLPSMQPMVSYFELPSGDVQRANDQDNEPGSLPFPPRTCPSVETLMEPLPTTYGEPMIGTICNIVSGPTKQPLSSQGSSALAPTAQGSSLRAPSGHPQGASLQAPSFQPQGASLQAPALQVPSPPGTGSSAAQQYGIPACTSYVPAAQGSYVAQPPSFVTQPTVTSGATAYAPSAFMSQAANAVQNSFTPNFAIPALQLPLAQPSAASAPLAQAFTQSPPQRSALPLQGLQQPQWQFSQAPAAMQLAMQCQHQQLFQQAWTAMPRANTCVPQTSRQPTAEYPAAAAAAAAVKWPEHLTAKQALFMSRVPSVPSQQPQQQRQPEHPAVVKSEPVSSNRPEPEGVDAMTKTQEIYIYPEDERAEQPTPNPKGAVPTPQPHDDISFAGEYEGSVVIQSGSARVPVAVELANMQNVATPEKRTAKQITQCLVDAAEDGDLDALREAIRRAMLANLDQELIDWAHLRMECLEEENWSLRVHRGASEALKEAMQSKSTEFLKAALERAESVGVQGTLLKKAQDELNRRHSSQEAEAALLKAMAEAAYGSSCTGLALAVDWAASTGVGEELVAHARKRLRELDEYASSRQASSTAEHMLKELVNSCDDVSTLTAALETAREAGACLKVIDSARKKKHDLEEESWQAQSRDLAERRSERTIDGISKDEYPVSEAGLSNTPVSTIGIVEEAREELVKLMRMPTRSLDEAEPSASPIHMESEVSYRLSAPQALCPDASQAPEPASEPTIGLEASGQQTPGMEKRATNPLDVTDMTPPRASMPDEQPAPAPRSSWRPSQVLQELPIYGLDAELKAKADAKYDNSAEDQVAKWIQDITGVQVVGEFGEALRTGQVLCQLLNCIKPGTIAKINTAGTSCHAMAVAKERENITKFLKVCREWGVHEYAVFSTDDLYDEKNLMSVVKCIYQLGGVLKRAVPEFQGPHLGVADMSNAKRDAKRDLEHASQTGGLHGAIGRSHIDMLSTGNVRGATRGGC